MNTSEKKKAHGGVKSRSVRSIARCIAAAILVSSLSACAALGPKTIGWNRTDYNQALQKTDAQQLILNIVRQRYADPVMFLDVTSISNSVSRDANFSLGAAFQRFVFDSASMGAGGSIAENPIVFYAPNTGESFVKKILTPIDVRTISLLLQSGWSIERVLMVAGDSINGFRNATTARDSKGQIAWQDYRDLVRALRDLQRDGLLAVGTESGKDGVDSLVLMPAAAAANAPAYLKVCDMLKIPCDGGPMRLYIGIGAPAVGGGQIVLATRSLYAAFYYLSDGVDVPAADLQKGYVKARETAGGPFDRASGDLFKLQVSSAEPPDEVTKVHYRDAWFFIADNDTDTKTTFGLLSIILMLEGTDTVRASPLVSVSPR